MKKAVKTFTLSAVSMALLSGCVFEQSYEPPVPAPRTDIQLYGKNSDSRFALSVKDKDGNLSVVSDSGDVLSLNIKTQAVGAWESGDEGNVFVSISENQPASVLTSSESLQDINQYTNDATIQFALLPISQAQRGKAVTVSLPRVAGGESVVDITNVVNAFVGSKQVQQVKLPVSCFKDSDFSHIDTPFALNSESNLYFELGDISINPDSLDEAQVLACATEGALLDEAVSIVFASNDGQVTGWADEVVADKDVIATPVENGVNVTYFGKNVLAGGITFSTTPEIEPINNDDIYKDLSLFMENGELQFEITVDSFGQHPTGEFEVSMQSDQGEETGVYSFLLPMAEGNLSHTITVPVKELLTQDDGIVAVNTALNMKKPFSIQPAAVSAGGTLMEMDFTINNVQLHINAPESAM